MGTRNILVALFVACVAILIVQLFIPPYVGMADNGDFSKVTMRFSLKPAEEYNYKYDYVNADYVKSPRYFWVSPLFSTEIWPATLAVHIKGVKNYGDTFNIRWLGAIHTAIFLLAFFLLMRALRPLPSWVAALLGAVALWIFTDVLYVSYLNSFYSDTTALLGLFGAAAAAILLATEGPSARVLAGFTFFSLLLIGSKPQHAIWGFVPALFVFLSCRGNSRTGIRRAGWGLGILLFGAEVVVLGITPSGLQSDALFNLIFVKIANNSSTPLRDLEELGLSSSELPNIGHTAWFPNAPTGDLVWAENFRLRSGYARVARFYLRHPSRPLRMLYDDLRESAPYLRFGFANFRRQDASRPRELSYRFSSWSSFRMRLFFAWPSHVLVWYFLLAAGIAAIIVARPSPTAVRLSWMTGGLIVAASLDFGVSSLSDGAETFRHLLLFHAITDITVCMALAAIVTGTLRACVRPR